MNNVCLSCGRQVAGVEFCPRCGKELAEESMQAVEETPAAGGGARRLALAVSVLAALVGGVFLGIRLTGGGSGVAGSQGAEAATQADAEQIAQEPADSTAEESPEAGETQEDADESQSTEEEVADPLEGYRFLLNREWRGEALSDNTGTVYAVELRVNDATDFPLTGQVAMMNTKSGQRGVWKVKITPAGTGIVVVPKGWVVDPGADWRRDYLHLFWSDEDKLAGSAAASRRSDSIWGSIKLR